MPGFGQPEMRRFGDHEATRNNIYDGALSAVQSLPPVENQRYKLSIQDPGWTGSGEFSIADHKNALLTGRTLGRRLSGTFTLTDKATNNVVDSRRMTVASVPALNRQGTFIMDGSGYAVSHQLRLLPGIYSRRKSNGEIESHVSHLPGKGASHRLVLDPETGVFKINVGQAEIPAVALMKAMGATKEDLEHRWGRELAAINLKADRPHHLDKLYEKMGPSGPVPETPHEKAQALAAKVSTAELDPWVSKRTLGNPHKYYDKHAMLAATGKLLDIARGKAEPDDRDNPMFSMVWGPEHVIAERIERSKPLLAKMLWQATNNGHLQRLQPGPLTPAVRAVFTKSGLALLPEGTSASEFVDHGARITKVGEGGIGKSAESIPMASRDVNAGQFPFIDPVRTSESTSVGVDLRVAFGTKLGKDKRIYAPIRDAKTGKIVYRSPQDLADKTIAFPNAHLEPHEVIPVIRGGKLTYAPRHEVHYHVPSMEQSFSPLTNMVPMKSASKAHRSSMGARMQSQALPLDNAEAPWVRSQVPGQAGKSFEELFGRHMGAEFANNSQGIVESVEPGKIAVRYADGTRKEHEIYNHLPSGRKSSLHATPLVKPGDQVRPGQILAKSNYTDDKGHAAYGLNARTAFMNFPSVYEDAIAVSQSFANRMKSDHLYKHELFKDEHTTHGKAAHAAAFPGKYPLDTLKAFDDNGVIKPGTIVNKDDPIILAVRKRQGEFGRLSRSGKTGVTDASEVWHYDEPGEVTDAIQGPHGPVVLVKSQKVLQSGDKLCYDAETEILTRTGWKSVVDVTPLDLVASLSVDGELEYVAPVATHVFPYAGRMYRLETTQVSMCVTPDHKLYAKPRDEDDFGLVEARHLFGTRFELKSNATWLGSDLIHIELSNSAYTRKCGRGGAGTKHVAPVTMPTETYLMLLGAFLTDGYTIYDANAGNYGLGISQIKTRHRDQLRSALKVAGIKFVERPDRFLIYSRGLAEHLRLLGKTATKHIPDSVFDLSPRLLRVLFDWMNWGDGTVTTTHTLLTTGSKRLAGDYQRLCLHLGYSARIKVRPAASQPDSIKGIPVKTKNDSYSVFVYLHKSTPTINHGHVKTQQGQKEEWVDYAGSVYCVTLPCNHVLYTRRNGKPVWSGNSGRHGNKGIAVVHPDHEMPHGADGNPVDMILSSLGTISRTNSSAIFEAALGKIVRKTGQPYVYDDFQHGADASKYVQGELAKHGISFKEDLTDPKTGRKIPGVSVGDLYAMKLTHMAVNKSKGRGLGATDESGQPTRGQNNGAMRMSLGDTNALLSSGATNVIHDAHSYRGQSNPDFWLSYMAGFPTPKPTKSDAFNRFLTELRASGVDPVHKDSRYHLMALTNQRVKELAGDREVKNGETLDFSKNGAPYAGGLHSPEIFGAVDSTSTWAKIPLHEPMLNPVMEEPARRLLGLTEAQFRDVIAHKHSIPTGTGPKAIADALGKIDVAKELAKTREQANSSRKTTRDEANRKLVYLKGLEKTKQSPKDWILDSAPVLPPGFRPVTSGPNGVVIADANLLYSDLIGANDALKKLSKETTDVGAEKLNLYDSVKAVMGLGDPVGAKNKERGVRGILARLLGETSKACYDEKTEILTQRGWIPFANLTIDDTVATCNPANGFFEWQKPTAIHQYDHDGEMVRLSSGRTSRTQTQKVNLLLTPNHRHWYRVSTYPVNDETVRDGWRLVPVMEMPRSTRNYQTAAAGWAGGARTIPDCLPPGCDPLVFAEFLGWWVAEGWIHSSGSAVQLSQSATANPEAHAHLTVLLPKLGYAISNLQKTTKLSGDRVAVDTWWYFKKSRALADWLRAEVGCLSTEKRLPRLVLDWDVELLRAFIAGYLGGDGNKCDDRKAGGTGVTTNKNRSTTTDGHGTFTTASRALYDGLQEVFCKLGVTVSLRKLLKPAKAHYAQTYRGALNGRWYVGVSHDISSRTFEHYTGKVYCCTVPNGLLFVRREETVCVSGNSYYQQKLLGSPTNLSGRAQALPNPDLDMDEVGVPESMAWSVYHPFVVRRMVRQGISRVEAAQMAADKHPKAKQALLDEMGDRPIIMTRYPALHRHSVMAFNPRLVAGSGVHVNNLVTKPYGGDYDGDAYTLNVPLSDDAVKEAREKLFPSKNLFSPATMRASTFLNNMEYQSGLHIASTRDNQNDPIEFRTLAEARAAAQRGEINLATRIRILSEEKRST